MLQSARFLRPGWRSLLSNSRGASPSYSVHVQRRLGALRANSSAPRLAEQLKSPIVSPETSDQKIQLDSSTEPRLAIAFTCTADECNHRSAHTFTKRAYQRGIVLIQCPSCKNRHLIADNLGWFKEDTQEGKLRNIEDILRVRGERVQRGVIEVSDS